MAGNQLQIIEQHVEDAMPTLANILAATPGIPPRSFKAGLLSQMQNEKTRDKIMACTLPSLMNCASTFAGLGLMPDGVTGQAFILPFNDRKAGMTLAVPVVGYKGYNTLGDRAGRTITGKCVYEGDPFDYDFGTGQVSHKIGADRTDRILFAWAKADATNRTPILEVLPITELVAVMEKSPGYKWAKDSPYHDLKVGRPAMFEKTAKRRLARGMPLLHGPAGGYVMADSMEQQFDLTERPHYIQPGPDGTLQVTDGITGEVRKPAPPPSDDTDPTEQPVFRAQINSGQGPTEFPTINQWKVALHKLIGLQGRNKTALGRILEANAPFFAEVAAAGESDAAMEMERELRQAIENAGKPIGKGRS